MKYNISLRKWLLFALKTLFGDVSLIGLLCEHNLYVQNISDSLCKFFFFYDCVPSGLGTVPKCRVMVPVSTKASWLGLK